MGPTLILAVAMALPMGGGHGHPVVHEPAVQACDTCNCGHHGCLHKGGFWTRHGLPAPCHAPGNMYQHMPYDTAAMRYYYFRPYNYMHIQVQQAEAVSVGTPAGLPYSNAIFQRVYAEVGAAAPAAETVPAPMESEAPPAPPAPGAPAPDSPLDTPAPQPSANTGASVSFLQTLVP